MNEVLSVIFYETTDLNWLFDWSGGTVSWDTNRRTTLVDASGTCVSLIYGDKLTLTPAGIEVNT